MIQLQTFCLVGLKPGCELPRWVAPVRPLHLSCCTGLSPGISSSLDAVLGDAVRSIKSEDERSFGCVLSRSVHLNLLHFLRRCVFDCRWYPRLFPFRMSLFYPFRESCCFGTSGQSALTQLREGPAEGLLLVCCHANTQCPVNRLTPSHKHGTIHLRVCVGRLREQEGMFQYIAPDLVVMQKSEVGGDPFPLLWGCLMSTSSIHSFEVMSRKADIPCVGAADAHPAEEKPRLASFCLYFCLSHGSMLCFLCKLCNN